MFPNTPRSVKEGPARCQHCGAVADHDARNCWLCQGPIRSKTRKNTATQGARGYVIAREVPLSLKLAPLAAIPTVALVIYGLALHEPGLAIVYGPPMAIATLVALIHHFANREKTLGQSFLAGLIAGAITALVTHVIAAVLLVVFLISIFIALKEFCAGLSNM